jgi:hypothetical protein
MISETDIRLSPAQSRTLTSNTESPSDHRPPGVKEKLDQSRLLSLTPISQHPSAFDGKISMILLRPALMML